MTIPRGRGEHAAFGLCVSVRGILSEQAAGWRERSFFERRWMVRDFRKRAGMPTDISPFLKRDAAAQSADVALRCRTVTRRAGSNPRSPTTEAG